MLPVIWTASARKDLYEIIDYISDVNHDAAERLQERLEAAVLPLSTYPYLYPKSRRMPFYREIVAHPNYLVFYRVLADRVQIEMVAHGRRNFPIA